MAGIKGRSGSGGRRVGAGRKPKAETFGRQIERAEKVIATRSLEVLESLIKAALAEGQVVEEYWEPAGLQTVTVTEKIEPKVDPKDKDKPPTSARYVRILKLVFPDLPAGEMVLVRRAVRTLLPDTKAGMYLLNRIMGSPSTEPEEGPPTAVESKMDWKRLTPEEIDALRFLIEKCTVAS